MDSLQLCNYRCTIRVGTLHRSSKFTTLIAPIIIFFIPNAFPYFTRTEVSLNSIQQRHSFLTQYLLVHGDDYRWKTHQNFRSKATETTIANTKRKGSNLLDMFLDCLALTRQSTRQTLYRISIRIDIAIVLVIYIFRPYTRRREL